MSDENIIKGENIIKDCTACGWWCKKVWRFSNNQCDPKRGEIARNLAEMVAKLPNVTATIQGYGYGSMGITVGKEDGKHFTIVFTVDRKTVHINQIFWSRHDKPESIAALIAMLSLFNESAL